MTSIFLLKNLRKRIFACIDDESYDHVNKYMICEIKNNVFCDNNDADDVDDFDDFEELSFAINNYHIENDDTHDDTHDETIDNVIPYELDPFIKKIWL